MNFPSPETAATSSHSWRKQFQVRAIEVRAVNSPVVGIFGRLAAVRKGAAHLTRLLVEVQDLIDVPVTLRDRIFFSCPVSASYQSRFPQLLRWERTRGSHFAWRDSATFTVL